MPEPNDCFPTASWQQLYQRAKLLQAVRDFFRAQGFLEVETPLLSRDTVIDRHLDPLAVTMFEHPQTPEEGQKFWLQTSPEFGMKRLLAGGAPSIFQITRAFRGAECGPWHNVEFTMVEWYGLGHDYQQGMNLLAQLAEQTLGQGSPERLSYSEAFERYAGIHPLRATTTELLQLVQRSQWVDEPTAQAADRDFLLDLILTYGVQPHLGKQQPTILFDYPASQAALAKVRHDEYPVAERFELFAQGVELANGYHELTDAAILQQRNREQNAYRLRDGKQALPEDSRLLEAMQAGLPPCTGCALGFDRLCMVALGASSLAEVIAFGQDRA